MPVAAVGQWTPNIRQSAYAWFAGRYFTGGTIRYTGAATVSATDDATLKAEIKASIDGSYYVTNPTTVNWATTGIAAGTNLVESDNLIRATFNIEWGYGNGEFSSFCCPFIVRNASGDSPTYVMNKPKIFGLCGVDPSKMYSGMLYALVGRNLSAQTVKPSVWLWDGNTPVDTSKLYRCTLIQPAGKGTGDTVNNQRNCLHFEIPSTVPAGNYKLLVFTNENRYGITNPTGLSVTVIGTPSPYLSNPVVKTDLIATASHTDITQSLQEILFQAAYSASPASESAPWVIQLPPGVFYLKHVLPLPAHVGIVGAGINATRIHPNPALIGQGNASGKFYDDLSSYSTANGNCYTGTVNGTTRLSGIFSGDQKVSGRACLIRLRGDNTLFKDLTLEASPDDWRVTVLSIIGAFGAINRASLHRVKLYNQLAVDNGFGYCYGLIYRWSQQKYWNVRSCDLEGQVGFEQPDGQMNGYSNNGSADNFLVQGGSYKSVYERWSDSHIGACLGRGSLIYGVDISRTRRGMAIKSGTGCMESAMVACNFGEAVGEIHNGEAFISEARSLLRQTGCSATSNTVTIPSDTVDRKRWVCYIAEGTGKYQYRTVASSSAGTHTLEDAWEIVPDSSSVVCMTQCPVDIALIGNKFVGTVGGINLYGCAFGVIAAANTFWHSQEGIMLNTNWNTSQASGFGGQSGDGCSVSMWHSFLRNVFADSAGFQFVAPRTTADLATTTYAQIGLITLSENDFYGAVTNSFWAAEGGEQTGDENGANIQSVELISYVGIAYCRSFTDRGKYLHTVITKTVLNHNVFFRSLAGVGHVYLAAHKVDDVTVSNQSVLFSTSATSNNTGHYSLNTLLTTPGASGSNSLSSIIGDVIDSL